MSAEKVIEAIIKRKIDWFDPLKLDKGRQQAYKTDAEFITGNETFLNELNH